MIVAAPLNRLGPRAGRLLAILFGVFTAFAAYSGLMVPAAAAPPPATFTASASPGPVRPGETVAINIVARIASPWHVYSVVPVPPPGPIETSVAAVKAGTLKPIGKLTESAPKRMNDPQFGKEVAYHDTSATFTQRLLVPKTAKPGRVPVTLTLRYMACNERVCLPPRNVDVTTTVTVEAGTARAEFNGAAAAADVPPPTNDPVTRSRSDDGLAAFLLAAFGAGLLALVTPCVFPMIPVTLAFFTKQATAKADSGARVQGTVVRLALVYCVGIVVAFTLIGAVLAATVGAAGANRLATNPWVNLGFAVLFILFGLALLEVMELRLPASLQGLTGVGRRSGGGTTWGVLGMGLTFVIAAFTCTAPFVGTVLVAAANASTGGQWVRPVLGMAVFASALALPFFVLALFPGWLARMPRSGAWLSTVKGTMGFVELAAALKFLSNTDLVLQWKILTTAVLLALWAVLALGTALWLLGVLRVGFATPEGRPTPARSAWAAAFGAVFLYCLWGLSGRPLNGWVAAFLPPDGYGLSGDSVASGGAHADGLSWHDTLEAGLAQARAENRPVFVDFTGYACTNCRKMEKDVFPAADVHEQLTQFVRVRLYTDGIDDASRRNQTYQEKTFGDVALPLYAVLTPDGKPVSQFAGLSSVRAFAAFLRDGRDKVPVAIASAGGD